MMRRRCWQIALVGLALVAASAAPRAAVLIEAQHTDGEPIRMVADRAQQRVLLSLGPTRTLVDLAAGHLYVSTEDGSARRAHARFRPGHDEPPPYRVEPFGPGPMLAGHGSAYHVLFAEDQVCAELMLSAWMRPFVDPLVRALALLEPPPDPGDPCGRIPFTTYAAAGWPLLAGKIDHPTFVTTALRFDYDPAPGELAPPERFEDVPIEALTATLWR
jgi:hypothetical protein